MSVVIFSILTCNTLCINPPVHILKDCGYKFQNFIFMFSGLRVFLVSVCEMCTGEETKISIQIMFLSHVPQFCEYFISKCFFPPGSFIQSSQFLVFIHIGIAIYVFYQSQFKYFRIALFQNQTETLVRAKILNFLPQNLLDNEKKEI